MSTALLMDLKFYLNKLLKVDNIENYTLKDLNTLKKTYENFLERSDGHDPDFPTVGFGDKTKGEKVKGINKAQISEDEDSNEFTLTR